MGKLSHALKRFRRDVEGAVAVEFAFIAPVMIAIIFSLIELTDAVQAKRQVYSTVGMVGDLLTTFDVGFIEEDELGGILDIGNRVLEPYGIDDAEIRVTAVEWDATQTEPVVKWSRWQTGDGEPVPPSGTPGYNPGDVFPSLGDKVYLKPNEEMVGGYDIIVIELDYTFQSALSQQVIKDPITLSAKEVRVPRYATRIDLCPETCGGGGAGD